MEKNIGAVMIDVALSSLRLGAKEVHLFCLESREEMPAFEWEIEEAIREGVNLHCSRGPKRIIGKEGKISGLETILRASVFDAEGRFNPQFKEKTEDDEDNVYVADRYNHNIQKFDSEGNLLTLVLY